MKAHDVRHLRKCNACRQMGDKREMVFGLVHTKCAFKAMGLKGVKLLPPAEIGKFSLDEIGADAMRELVR